MAKEKKATPADSPVIPADEAVDLIGEPVHYTTQRETAEGTKPGDVHAAIITGVNSDGTVRLRVIGPEHDYNKAGVAQAEAPGTAGRWSKRVSAEQI